MSRYENIDTDNAIKKIFAKKRQESIEVNELYYNKDGKSIITDVTEDIVAKERYNPNTTKTTYYIKMYGGQSFNPQKTYDHGYKKLHWQLRCVKRSTFDMYIKFLETKRETYLRQVERSL